MTKCVLIGVLVLVLAAVGGLLLRADERAPQPRDDFAGKLVYVQARGGVRSVTLENVSIRAVGGRPFMVGKAIDDGTLTVSTYFTGAAVWVPVDEIESLAVYDGLAQLKRTSGK
jgi:hypothetical protein